MISLTTQPIQVEPMLKRLESRHGGAICLFLGTVREFTRDKRTLALEYEAYSEMAERKLAELEHQARARWPILGVEIAHRVGRLEGGEVSVAVAVSTPHRAESFEACRWLIDTLKEVVPIWKKEEWSDGSHEWIHPAPPTETRA